MVCPHLSIQYLLYRPTPNAPGFDWNDLLLKVLTSQNRRLRGCHSEKLEPFATCKLSEGMSFCQIDI